MDEESAQAARLKAAGEAYQRAGAVRALLGGYVPVGHPNHPSRWNGNRRADLAAAEDELARTIRELDEARKSIGERVAHADVSS
jgi:hypothetical protein